MPEETPKLTPRKNREKTPEELQAEIIESQLQVPGLMDEHNELLNAICSNLNIIARYCVRKGQQESLWEPDDLPHIEVDPNDNGENE